MTREDFVRYVETKNYAALQKALTEKMDILEQQLKVLGDDVREIADNLAALSPASGATLDDNKKGRE